MARIPFEQRQRILREVYRHYTDFKDHVSRTGEHFIEHGPVTISFSDLKVGVAALSERKKEAFFLNVILDLKQKDCADVMGIKMVSVGQYVEAACQQLAVRYFSEMSDEEVALYADAFAVTGTPDEMTERRGGRRYVVCTHCDSTDLVPDWPGQTGGDFAHMEDRPHRVCAAHHDPAVCPKCLKHAPHGDLYGVIRVAGSSDGYVECECGWSFTGDPARAADEMYGHMATFGDEMDEEDDEEPPVLPELVDTGGVSWE